MLDELTSYQSFSTDRWMIILSAGTVIVWLAVLVCLIISCV